MNINYFLTWCLISAVTKEKNNKILLIICLEPDNVILITKIYKLIKKSDSKLIRKAKQFNYFY